ncbi:MAG TPA: NHL repeat-containing protein [Acidobacteriaceae bacterium]|nr:NHL repeat-containing protein [Acidobacteriaceae bacterium]
MKSTTPASATLTFTFASGGNIAAPVVVTQGATNLDFTDAGTGTCTTNGSSHNYATNDTCTVVVHFTPGFVGACYGAVEILDTSGNLLATGNLEGTGVGPLAVFALTTSGKYAAGRQTVLSSGVSSPNGVAVDASGDIFVTNAGDNTVEEMMAVNGSVPASPIIRTLGSGFVGPNGIAVDGSGNVFIADRGSDSVKEIVAAGGYTTVNILGSGFGGPNGVAVDANDNVFVADWVNDAVYEIVAAGGYTTVKSLGSRFDVPDHLAVDGNGNVFVADFFNSAVKEILAAGGYTTVNTLVSKLPSPPCGVAVDASGNVFVTGWESGVAEEIFAAGGYTTVQTLDGGFDLPSELTVDGNGNVIVTDTGRSRLVKLDYADPPSLTFATTVAGQTSGGSPQTVTVQNIGNQPLIFPIPATGNNPTISANFTLDSSGTDACPLIGSESGSAGTLAAGASCQLAISFTPASGNYGSTSGSLLLTDNMLKAAGPGYSVQTITLTGTGAGIPPFGTIGQIVDATTRSTTVAQGDDVLISGWAADPQDGAPVHGVTVLIDGSAVGQATLGILRQDVAAARNNLLYSRSGWSLVYPAATLSTGSHTVTAVVTDSQELSTTLLAKSFTVTASPVAGPPFGALGGAIDATTHSTTVAIADPLLVYGWAADVHDGAPVSSVTVLLDGAAAGNASLGIARPDVVANSGQSAYLHSGWTFTTYPAGLALGKRSVTAVATDSLGLSTTFGPKTITVAAAPVDGPPFGSLDKAEDSATGSATVSQSDGLLVSGWAADHHDGAPVSSVTILIDGAAAGNATLGLSRPDVAKAENNPSDLHSGWKFTSSASGLTLGTHTVTAVALDSLGLSTQLEIRVITVTP